MNARVLLVFSAVLGLLTAGEAAAQKLSLRIERGAVTIDADNVTVDEILARWTDITGMNVVSKNGEGSDIPVTLHLSGVPEPEALRLVLRDLSGYIMGERHDARSGIVSIDRLVLLPQSAPLASPQTAPAPRLAPGRRVNTIAPSTAAPIADDGPAREESSEPAELAPAPTGRPRRLAEGRLIGTGPGAVLDFTGAQPNVDPGLEEQSAPEPAAPPAPSNPFGNSQGASRPGDMTAPRAPYVPPQIIDTMSGGGRPSAGVMPIPPTPEPEPQPAPEPEP